jgi:hypothetical protein
MWIAAQVDRRDRSMWWSGLRWRRRWKVFLGRLKAPARERADLSQDAAKEGRDGVPDPSGPHDLSQEQRPCQLARPVHKSTGMCTCRLCVSERIFLRILALLVA